MKIFEHDNYKTFVRERIQNMPQKGRGQYRQLAKELRMHTTLVSQVFGGERELTPEQGCDLCAFWGLTALETEMFLALLQKSRAGTLALKKVYTQQIENIRDRADKFASRLPQDKMISSEVQSVFYSNWYYSAIRLLTSVPGYRTVDSISAKLGLPRPLVSEVIEFLLAHGLCVLNKKNQVVLGAQRTHLDKNSPLVARHHTNWRVKSLSQLERLQDHEVLFTAPLSISKADAIKVRKKIFQFVEEVSDIVKETSPEKVCYLNIDWLDV